MKFLIIWLLAAVVAFGAPAAPSGVDFNRDGIDDLLVRNTTTGATYSWLMNSSGSRSSAVQISTIPMSDWNIEGTGDYNGDGVTDIVVRNKTNGQTFTWLMNSDGTRASYQLLATISESDWEIAGTDSDFNNDGVNDIVVRNTTNGYTYAWLMNNDGTRGSYALLAVIPEADWQIAGTNSDFNNDGISDIVVRNRMQGWTYIWLMNSDGTRSSYKHITNLPEAMWEIAGTESDFNQDGTSDIVVRERTYGYTYVWLMNSDGSRASYRHITNLPESDWEIAGTNSDFNRDGTSDLVVRNKTSGATYTWLMNSDGTRANYNVITNIPESDWEIAGTNSDYNLDGTSDLTVRHRSSGATYSWLMDIAGTRSSSVLIANIPESDWEISGSTDGASPVMSTDMRGIWNYTYEEGLCPQTGTAVGTITFSGTTEIVSSYSYVGEDIYDCLIVNVNVSEEVVFNNDIFLLSSIDNAINDCQWITSSEIQCDYAGYDGTLTMIRE